MKKFRIAVLSVITACALLLTGTGCKKDSELYFSNAFDTEYSLSAGYTETCVYDLTVDKNFNDELKKADKLNGIVNDISVMSGSYVTRLSVTPAVSGSAEQWKGSDISNINGINELFYLETELKFTINVNGTACDEDTIVTKTYFCPKDFSYAPIHTTTEYDCTNLTIENNALKIGRLVYTSSTVYNQASYVTVTTTPTATQTIEDEYTFRSLIDNNQLLFALRNVSIDVDSSSYIPTNSHAYKKVPTLKITNKGNYAENYTLNANFNGASPIAYNGQNVTVTHNSFTYCVSEKFNTGINNYLLIQSVATNKNSTATPATEALPHRSLLIRYAQPVLAGGFIAGALVYTLSSVSVA
ncbi:MAG: hypothetical protein IJZ73_02240 [Clostridia bacterium]|nr:hypothetical protein [Clostridia bacterium]